LGTCPNRFIVDHFENGTQPFTTFAQHKFIWQTKETVVKMFSANRMEEDQLSQLFFSRSWTYRKKWDAYPELRTVETTHWMPIVLDGNTENGIDTAGIFYVNSFESLFSVGEISILYIECSSKLNLTRMWGFSTHM
jgi:prenylcysteine oxidase / farnesylcysteine lyase